MMLAVRMTDAQNRMATVVMAVSRMAAARATGVPDPRDCPSRDRSNAAFHAGASSRSLV